MSAEAAFTAHALGVRRKDIPAEAIAAARTFYLDTLCVGAAGAMSPLAEPVRSVVRRWGTGGKVAVWGTGETLPAASAAYVNGFQIHCQEYDCVHERAVVHPMATIGAALTADAADRGHPGADLLAAIVVAVDVAAGLGVAVTSPIRFFRPATAGLFGATLGIARMRGFDEATARNALGYALAQAAGTMQAHVEGKPALPIQIAQAARAAIVACDLAEAGLEGPSKALEGPYGYFALFEQSVDPKPVLASLGRIWRVLEISHKPWPTGRAAQGGIALMQALRAEGVVASEVESIRLIAPPLIKRLVGRKAFAGMGINHARLCFQYVGARALMTGQVGLSDFTESALGDADTLTLGARIEVVEDGTDDPAAFTPQITEARLKDGRQVTVETRALYGSPQDPMRPEDQRAKQETCLAFARLPLALADTLAARVAGMETEAAGGAIAALLRP
ncbi:MAG: MmgE/PrpD family protein [Oceanicaulis sp.]|uniref:MmgE/PrpD family protein n=1 Tax=Glycocaulis sp. TaxID=1969725 RepID=UPI0025B9BE07|nr:MmgE/PrpD family protein [Glycocaulis sp.]MCC5980084.1 MmgE/PrpD family protein [Oceanicaulis sp.]MCH8522166.1 MmgE/PrpD family protein [Glycocaulis sp.]